jgi:hypothetical protein
MKTPVKKAVQQKFDTHSLSADQLQTLISRQKQADMDPGLNKKTNQFLLPGAIATSILLLGIVLTWFGNPPMDKTQTIASAIANEVVSNHLHRKPMEVQASTVEEIRSYFTQLPIQLINSRALKPEFGQLKGGRYCSIQGVTAAQLRLKTAKGKTNTYYQAEYQPDVHGPLPDIDRNETPLLVYAKGIGVYLWREKGLIFALTDE